MRIVPDVGSSSPAIIRSVVVLPHPDGPSSVTSVPAAIDERDAIDGRHVAVALGDVAELDRGGFHRGAVHVTPCAAELRDSGYGCRAQRRRRRPSRRSPTSIWMIQIATEHQHDQHRAVRDRDAVVAVDDAIDDVGRRPFVLRGHEEDHRRHRRHRADEAVDQRGDDGWLQQRQQDRAQDGETARAERCRRLVETAVDLRHRRHAGAHAHRHVAEHVADDEDQRRARELDRRHVEREDVRDADHRAGNGERQHRAELEQRLAGEFLPREEVGGEKPQRGGDRRGDRRELHRRPERAPARAGPDHPVRTPFDAERLDVVAAASACNRGPMSRRSRRRTPWRRLRSSARSRAAPAHSMRGARRPAATSASRRRLCRSSTCTPCARARGAGRRTPQARTAAAGCRA